MFASFSLALLFMVCVAILIDWFIGDPPNLLHPVQIMGQAIQYLEQRWNKGSAYRRRVAGFVLTGVMVLGTYVLIRALLWLLYGLHTWLGGAVELLLLASTVAITGLKEAALAVARPLQMGDLAQARYYLSHIVGRDTEHLDEAEITRGTVETVAENTVDGITAPLFWALIGGAPLALAYKAINTLDSMVGHKNSRFADFGYASAKLDDAANWLPARLTAFCFWLAAQGIAGCHTTQAIARTCQQAPLHPSPNSGWPEAMVANLLGVQLGGQNYYQGVLSCRAPMGHPTTPLTVAHIYRTLHLMQGAWGLFMLLLAIPILMKALI